MAYCIKVAPEPLFPASKLAPQAFCSLDTSSPLA